MAIYHGLFYRQEEIDEAIEAQLAENHGFIDNIPRGTAHMFRYVIPKP